MTHLLFSCWKLGRVAKCEHQKGHWDSCWWLWSLKQQGSICFLADAAAAGDRATAFGQTLAPAGVKEIKQTANWQEKFALNCSSWCFMETFKSLKLKKKIIEIKEIMLHYLKAVLSNFDVFGPFWGFWPLTILYLWIIPYFIKTFF